MFRLAADIKIGDVSVTWADKLRIDSSWESLTDTCTFTIPNKVKDQNGEWREVFGRERLIDHGDPVRIEVVAASGELGDCSLDAHKPTPPGMVSLRPRPDGTAASGASRPTCRQASSLRS